MGDVGSVTPQTKFVKNNPENSGLFLKWLEYQISSKTWFGKIGQNPFWLLAEEVMLHHTRPECSSNQTRA